MNINNGVKKTETMKGYDQIKFYPIRTVKSNVPSVDPSSERNRRNDSN